MARHNRSSKKQSEFRVIKHDTKERPRPFDEDSRSFDEYTRPSAQPPKPLRAPSLMTCPNCKSSNYCEFKDDLGRTEGYCQYCSLEVSKTPLGKLVLTAKTDSDDVEVDVEIDEA